MQNSEESSAPDLDRFEAAILAKVHPHTLDAARERGEIPFARVGPHRKVVFERVEVLEWARRRSTPVRIDLQQTLTQADRL